jgi:hypothetical protein
MVRDRWWIPGAASAEAELYGTRADVGSSGEAVSDDGSSAVDATGEFCVEKENVKSSATSLKASKMVAVSDESSSERTESGCIMVSSPSVMLAGAFPFIGE